MRALSYIRVRTVGDLLHELQDAHPLTEVEFWAGDRQVEVQTVDVRPGSVQIGLTPPRTGEEWDV